MMKKIIAVILSLALIFTFAACDTQNNNGEETDPTGTQEQGEGTEVTEEGEQGEGEQEGQQSPINGLLGNTTELSLAAAPSVPVGEGVSKFRELAEEYSTGTLTIRENTDESLGDDKERLKKVMDGELDITIGLSKNFASTIKDLHLFDIYYLFESKEEVYDVALSKEMVDALEASFEKRGLKCLSLWGNGFSELSTNKKEVRKPKHLKGLKIATSDKKIDKAAWKAFGAKPVGMDLEDRAEAIEDKKIVAQESTLEAILNGELQNLQKYCIKTDHLYSPYVVVMNLDKFNSLGEFQQNAIIESVAYARNIELERCDSYNKYALDQIEKSEMEIVELTEKQMKDFVKKAKKAKTKTKAKKLMKKPELVTYLEDKLEVYRVEASAETEDETMDWEG